MRIIKRSTFVPKHLKLLGLFPKVGSVKKLDDIYKLTGIKSIESLRATISSLKSREGVTIRVKDNKAMRVK